MQDPNHDVEVGHPSDLCKIELFTDDTAQESTGSDLKDVDHEVEIDSMSDLSETELDRTDHSDQEYVRSEISRS